MTLKQFVILFVLPALVLLLAAFWFGSQANFVLALTGFLACFLISVALLIEGWKKYKKASESND